MKVNLNNTCFRHLKRGDKFVLGPDTLGNEYIYTFVGDDVQANLNTNHDNHYYEVQTNTGKLIGYVSNMKVHRVEDD